MSRALGGQLPLTLKSPALLVSFYPPPPRKSPPLSLPSSPSPKQFFPTNISDKSCSSVVFIDTLQHQQRIVISSSLASTSRQCLTQHHHHHTSSPASLPTRATPLLLLLSKRCRLLNSTPRQLRCSPLTSLLLVANFTLRRFLCIGQLSSVRSRDQLESQGNR